MKSLREMIDIVEGADPTQADIKSVAEWMDTTSNNLNIEVVNEPIQKFIQQIKEMYGTFDENEEDAERTEQIEELLKQGAKALPIYVEKNDPELFVMEGRHRMVAFWLVGMNTIPVAYCSKKEEK